MTQFTRTQLKRYGITPDTNFGQHFLVDDNILDVIGRLSGVGDGDIVFEPGPGIGVLTKYLAERGAEVHAMELDERLRQPLTDLEDEVQGTKVHFGDAVNEGAASLDVLATHLISNLPYDVATPIVGETLQHAPWVRSFCVMVQKEVGERFFASPGTKQYGGISVLIQALCERTGKHAVARSVFKPQPNVDSMLVSFDRVREPIVDVPAFTKYVHSTFRHRRKTIANNLISDGYDRSDVEAACEAAGCAPGDRAEALEAATHVRLYKALRRSAATSTVTVNCFAPAKTNQLLHVGGVEDSGFHPLVSVMRGLGFGDAMRVRLQPADASVPPTERVVVEADGIEGGDVLVTQAAIAFLRETNMPVAVNVQLDKVTPTGAGLGGGSSDAGTVLRLLNEHCGYPSTTDDLARMAASIGSDIAFFLHGGQPCLVHGRGEQAVPIAGLADMRLTVIWPSVHLPTPAVYTRLDEGGWDQQLPAHGDVLAAAHDGKLYNDLAVAATELCPEIATILELAAAAGVPALVSGSGSSCILDATHHQGAAATVVQQVAEQLPAARTWSVRALE